LILNDLWASKFKNLSYAISKILIDIRFL